MGNNDGRPLLSPPRDEQSARRHSNCLEIEILLLFDDLEIDEIVCSIIPAPRTDRSACVDLLGNLVVEGHHWHGFWSGKAEFVEESKDVAGHPPS